MYVFFNVAEIGALRSVVPARQLPAAAAAEQARYSTVILVAPPLGGSLFGLGRALPFLADAVSYVFSLASLLAMRTPFQEEREHEQSPLRTQLAEGFRWLWGHRFLRTCALLFTWVNLVFEALFLVLIVVGRRQGLSGGADRAAHRASSALCSLVGSFAAPRLQRRLSMRTYRRSARSGCSSASSRSSSKPSVYVLARRRPAGGALRPERERGRHRLPRRRRPRPADRPRRTASRARSRSAALPLGPLAAGPAARFVLRADDRRDLRGLSCLLLARVRDAQPVDSERAEPRRARRPSYWSFSRSSRLTTFGSALPPVSFITWPTRKPSTPSLPPRYVSTCSGFAARTRVDRRARARTRR